MLANDVRPAKGGKVGQLAVVLGSPTANARQGWGLGTC